MTEPEARSNATKRSFPDASCQKNHVEKIPFPWQPSVGIGVCMGELCAIGCALTWSISVIIFKRMGHTMHPLMINLFKNAVGFALMIPTMYLVEGTITMPTNGSDFFILIVSGMIGIGVADGLFLLALNLIGASRTAIVECMYSPMVIILSLVFLGETLSVWQLVGAMSVVFAVLMVNIKGQSFTADRRKLVFGTTLGILAMTSMATGIVMVKPVFPNLPLLWIIVLRMAAGLLMSAIIVAAHTDRSKLFRELFKLEGKHQLLLGSILASYISMVMWVAGFKYSQASIAAVLNQTATIFTVLLAAIVLNERLNATKIAATAAAFGGVLIIVLSS